MKAMTLLDKIWDRHVVRTEDGDFIDLSKERGLGILAIL